MKAIRVYADTSVFGGVYDDEFKEPSRTFFEQVKSGQFVLVTSAVVQDEMVAAPPAVRHFFEELLGLAEVTDITASALELRAAYLQAKIVTPKFSADALFRKSPFTTPSIRSRAIRQSRFSHRGR